MTLTWAGSTRRITSTAQMPSREKFFRSFASINCLSFTRRKCDREKLQPEVSVFLPEVAKSKGAKFDSKGNPEVVFHDPTMGT